MWTILNFEKNNYKILKNNLIKKLGKDTHIYCPVLLIQTFRKNKLISKEFNLLGNYLFCFNKNLKNRSLVDSLKYIRGLKYFLSGCLISQQEIELFIRKCKSCENKDGYISQDFFNIQKNFDYKFMSGPFADKIFKLLNFQKNKLEILLGKVKTSINKEKFLFTPI